MSLRDVYYALKHLFNDQMECNACILELGKIILVKRADMNIVPLSKGFVSGRIKFRFITKKLQTIEPTGGNPASAPPIVTVPHAWIDCDSEELNNQAQISTWWSKTANSQGLTPSEGSPCLDVKIEKKDGSTVNLESLRFIVIVEKQGIFNRLVEVSSVLFQARFKRST